MISLPGGSAGPPGLRRPTFTIAFGAAGGGGGIGALGAAVAGAVGLGTGAEDPWRRSILSITVEAALAPIVDRLELVLSADPTAPSVAVGDTGSVSFGYSDAGETAVFTGTVDRISRTIEGRTRVSVRNGSGELARLRLNQSFESMSAGDIASDLAGRLSVQTGAIESGETLPFVALDDRTSAWGHLAVLARRGGCIAFVDPDGRLNLARPGAGDPVQTFHYGSDVLALEIAESSPEAGEVTAIGEGAAGSAGADAWAWIVKDPAAVTGTAGSGSPERAIADRALRSAQAAGTAAQAIADAAAARAVTGRLRVAGAPAVTAGSVVEVAEAPADVMNGRFLVQRLRHRVDKKAGFVTELGLVKVVESGPGGLGGLL